MGMIVGVDKKTHLESANWRGEKITIPYRLIHDEMGQEFRVYNVQNWFPDKQRWIRSSQYEVQEVAFHHDAVAFDGLDKNFNGSNMDESMWRLSAIYNYHVQQDWNGIGYHAVIDRLGRIFVSSWDVLDTHRAHVAGYDPARNNVSLNNIVIGVCFMGNFADWVDDETGRVVAVHQDRPTPKAMDAADAFARYAAGIYFKRELELHPHSWYGRYPGQGDKPCPGLWASPNSWIGFRYPASMKVDTVEPSEPRPDPEPEKPAETDLPQVTLEVVINGRRFTKGDVQYGHVDQTTDEHIFRKAVDVMGAAGWVVAGVKRKR